MEIHSSIEAAERRTANIDGFFRVNFVGIILLILLVSRYFSEALTTYVWPQTNQIWAVLALAGIGFLLWPLMTMISRVNSIWFQEYWPILTYLLYLAIRTQYFWLYSLKCFLTELIIWFIFIFTREACSWNNELSRKVIIWTVTIAKISILIGLGQIIWCVFEVKSVDLFEILNQRPVRGIFDHPTTYIICNFIFAFYFLKHRDYRWLSITILTCIFTGTRSPFVALLTIGLLLIKSVLFKPIKWRDIIVTLIAACAVYFTLINLSLNQETYTDWRSRDSQASLYWRINFWKNFLESESSITFLIGHGIGTADYLFERGTDRPYPPHNDYVRVFYDSGLVGLIIFLNLMLNVLRTLKKSSHIHNDYIILSFFVILCFCFTDNFIYFSQSVLILMFLASSAARGGDSVLSQTRNL